MKLSMRPPVWMQSLMVQYVPFADAASPDLPLGRLFRLALFQLSVGMTMALLVGTLNRVMIIELQVPAWWVALSVALPLVFAPLRAMIGYRSDTHPSALGLRRIPYMWMGTILMFGGLAIMPFALLGLSEPREGYLWVIRFGAAMAFLCVGAGMQITQTAGLALASDVSPEDKRPRVVALMYAMQLLGLIVGSAALSLLLSQFSPQKLIQVVQACAVLVAALNLVSLWKQEARSHKRGQREPDGFSHHWHQLMAMPKIRRFLWTVGLGTAAFSMQDIVLEPYGAQVLGLDVSLTSALTAMTSAGALLAFALSARFLSRGMDACRLAAIGAVIGLPAFACIIFSAPLGSALLFQTGATLIGFGGGLFSVGMLLTAMAMTDKNQAGMVLGAWGAVQATASGLAMALGGITRDLVGNLAEQGMLGEALVSPVTGYSVVFHIEMYMLFCVLIALGPLVSRKRTKGAGQNSRFGLAELPG